MQIFRNLKPYWKSVIIIALLLVLQAYCDLSLPDYTSKLIDTGIQNYGIEHCSPKQIPEKAYNVIDGFMDDDEKAVWEKYYENGSDGYYYLTEDGEDHIEDVDSACMKGLMMYYYPYQMVNSDEDNEVKAGLAKMGITLDEMPEAWLEEQVRLAWWRRGLRAAWPADSEKTGSTRLLHFPMLRSTNFQPHHS